MATSKEYRTVEFALWTSGEGRREEIWGKTFTNKILATVGHHMSWTIMPEDLPEESNTVKLDSALKDSDGIPAPKIEYRYSANTRDAFSSSTSRAHERLIRWLERRRPG